ncbi:unnamed protein product [Trichogramma brassicae]|uniref:MI domain-containing protein n=1 Tax=Trichogramma brassicae TaxID=86971 RepID=A0A6H5INQ3_9HYME|nr:unnamed protein product [Trichogramma brassicae]
MGNKRGKKRGRRDDAASLLDDKMIKSMEKKLKLKKKLKRKKDADKYIPKSFARDGLDYLLEICDEDSRKLAAENEKRLMIGDSDDESDSSNFSDASEPEQKKLKKKDTKKPASKVNAASDSTKKKKKKDESESEDDFQDFGLESDGDFGSDDDFEGNDYQNDDDDLGSKDNFGSGSESENEENDNVDNIDDGDNGDDSDKGDDGDDDDGIWEDIYGRKRSKDGAVITAAKQKYVAPALRLKELDKDPKKNEKLLQLKRQIKGLLNRLAESNMHTIVNQLEELYMSNSRNDMNEMLVRLMLDSIVSPVMTAERLVSEHMMCVAILHANIDTQVGSHFIMVLVKQFSEMIKEVQDVEDKQLDNLVLMICHLYNFKVFGSQLIYQILDKLIEKFTEKEIEIILVVLKNSGFRMRKDDPLALKNLVIALQQKAGTVKSTNLRLQFMLEVLMAIKNNDMRKIPQYDPTRAEHLKKIIKSFLRKGNTISQLNFSLEDLLNADEKGKWWIVGSAWSGKEIKKDADKTAVKKPAYSQKLLKLAAAQRMNTDVRKNIFCILMTAEDYLDAFEKLNHLGLKDSQEREIINVILSCCMQEKNFNPYYAVLLKKFNDFHKKYHVIKFGEMDKATVKFCKKLMLDILLHNNVETCLALFEAIPRKLLQFREGLRVFINFFLKKNTKKDKLSAEQMELLEKRIGFVDRILTTSKVTF